MLAPDDVLGSTKTVGLGKIGSATPPSVDTVGSDGSVAPPSLDVTGTGLDENEIVAPPSVVTTGTGLDENVREAPPSIDSTVGESGSVAPPSMDSVNALGASTIVAPLVTVLGGKKIVAP
jgi:hypothetical protein